MENVDNVEFSDFLKIFNFNSLQALKYYTNHRRFCLETVKLNPDFFKKIAKKFRDDEEISILAVKQKPRLLFSCGSISRSNPKVVQIAIEKDPTTIQFASDLLQDDEDFILKNAKILGKNIMYCYNFKRDEEMILKLVKENPDCFEGADKYLYHNKEFREKVNSIIEIFYDRIEEKVEKNQKENEQKKENFSIEEQVKFIIESKIFDFQKEKEKINLESNLYHREEKFFIDDLQLIMEDPMLLKFSNEKLKENEDFLKKLIKKNPISLKYSTENFLDNEEIVKNVLENLSKIFDFFNEHLKDNLEFSLFLEFNDVFNFVSKRLKSKKNINLLAMKSNGKLLKFVSDEFKNDKKIVTQALKSKGTLEYASEDLKMDKEIIKISLKENPENIKFIKTEELNSNEIKEILKFNGNFLQYFSNKIKNDLEYVAIALNQNPFSIQYASKQIQNDKKIALNVVQKEGICLEYFSNELKNEKEIVLKSIQNDGKSLMFCSPELKNDKEIITTSIQKDPFSFFNLSKFDQNNEEYALNALKKDHKIFDFLPESMKEKKLFLMEILKFREIPRSKLPLNLLDDKDILLLSIKSDLNIPFENYLNLDFLKEAIVSNQGCLIFAPFELQNDKNFILNLVKISKSLYCIPTQFHEDQEILWILNNFRTIRDIFQFENLNFKFRENKKN